MVEVLSQETQEYVDQFEAFAVGEQLSGVAYRSNTEKRVLRRDHFLRLSYSSNENWNVFDRDKFIDLILVETNKGLDLAEIRVSTKLVEDVERFRRKLMRTGFVSVNKRTIHNLHMYSVYYEIIIYDPRKLTDLLFALKDVVKVG